MARLSIQRQIQQISIEDGTKEFLKHCKASNYSVDTVKYYENTIHNFSLFFGLEDNISVLTRELMQDYQIYLSNKGLAEKTVRTYITGMRTILHFFMDEGYIESFRITAPKADIQIKGIYTNEEFAKLLKKPNLKTCSFAEYRNWVAIAYFIGTGQRVNSVINIKNEDLSLTDHLVTLRKTKGRRNTVLPLPSSLVGILKEYTKHRKGSGSDYLFCNQDGGQMTRSSITSAIRTYNQSRGVTKTSIHLFRHSFAKNYLNNGGNVFKLQKLMGHSDLKSTERYLNLMIDDIQQNYDEYNQLERLTTKRTIRMRGD